MATIRQHGHCFSGPNGGEQDVSDVCCDVKDMGVIWDTFEGITSNIVRKKMVGCSTPSNTKIIFRTINNHDIFV